MGNKSNAMFFTSSAFCHIIFNEISTTLSMFCFLHESNHSLTFCSFLDKLRKDKKRKGKDVQLKPLITNSLSMFPKKVTSDTNPKVRDVFKVKFVYTEIFCSYIIFSKKIYQVINLPEKKISKAFFLIINQRQRPTVNPLTNSPSLVSNN